MTRFAWRQFRLQALIAFGILAAVLVFSFVTGPGLVDRFKLPQPDALLIFVGLALVLLGFCFWWVRRSLS